MSQAAERQEMIRLHFRESDRKVYIECEDDRFVMSVEDAAAACRIVDRSGLLRFRKQFERLAERLAEWTLRHLDQVQTAMLTTRDAGLLFVVVRKTRPYDKDFERELTELDLEVAQDPNFDLICLSVLSLPECGPDGYQSFASERTWILEKS